MYIIANKVKSHDKATTLFRSNGVHAKLLKHYFLLMGQNYLKTLFSSLVAKVSNLPLEVIIIFLFAIDHLTRWIPIKYRPTKIYNKICPI
jgi:hypothetical protein